MNRFKRIAYDLFFAACICIIASSIITKIATGNASIFGYRIHHIQSESMEPTIKTGQIVIGKSIQPDDVQIGDIIIYKTGKHWYDASIAHRVVDITDEGYIFQGDNRKTNPSPDAPVAAEQIIEKVIWY